MATTAKKLDAGKWAAAKRQAVRKLGGHSARAMQLATRYYKESGGRYKGKKSGKTGLSKWSKQDWTTRPGTNPKAKREDGTTARYLPAKKWASMSEAKRKATDRKKIEASREGKKVVANTKSAKVRSDAKYGA